MAKTIMLNKLIFYMNKLTLIGLSMVATVSVASAYGKYDSETGMSLEGLYGISTDDALANVGGANLSLFNYIETGSYIHQISLNAGILAGSHHPSPLDLGTKADSISLRTTYAPLMAGYTFNMPIGESSMFYLGGKAGWTNINCKETLHYHHDNFSESNKESGWRISWAAHAGLKFAVSDDVDFTIGYEYYKVQATFLKTPDYHLIKLGFSWHF